MAKSTQIKDSWQHASGLAIKLLSLPNGRDTIDGWEYKRDADNLEHIRFWSSDAIEGSIGFSTISGYAKEKPYLMELAYWENKIRRSWSSDDIRQTNGVFDEIHPKFEYTWKWGMEKGIPTARLSFLRVDLAGNKFVNYEEGRNWQYWVSRGKNLPAEMPNSIEGLDEILGQTIPWMIDYQKTAQEFLDKTGLEEFVKAVRAYQGK